MGKYCEICGKPSGMYPLCKKHYQHEDIIKCDKCGHWYNASFGIGCPYCFIDNLEVCEECGTLHNPNYGCPICDDCGYDDQAEFLENIGFLYEPNSTQNNTCTICGADSGQYRFCPSCYHKYKNKIVTIQIDHCEEINIINDAYNSPLRCDDGHFAKSQQEVLIDNYLYNHNIRHEYEKPFPIDGDKDHDLHPDFYLPDLDVYIEHWGVKNNTKYEETKEYKIPFYKKAKITLICTDGDDIPNLSSNLERKLKFFEKGKINWLNKSNEPKKWDF